MVFKVVVGKSAKLDIENILDWYAGESISALEKFIIGLYDRFEALSHTPELFGLIKQRPYFRKVKIKRFPYYIVYRIDENNARVIISALIHERRNPEVWVRKLR